MKIQLIEIYIIATDRWALKGTPLQSCKDLSLWSYDATYILICFIIGSSSSMLLPFVIVIIIIVVFFS